MGECSLEEYPPPPRKGAVWFLWDDPSLVFEVSAYGHRGYDPTLGAPSKEGPVQNQYRGTWTMAEPPHESSELMQILTDAIIDRII